MKSISISLTIVILLSIFLFPTNADIFKTRIEELKIFFYGSQRAAYLALKTGDIDFMAFGLTDDQYADAVTDPNIVIAPRVGTAMFQFDINNNYTINTYPGVISPTSSKEFRQALARLTDKNYIVEVVLEGHAERIDVPVSAAVKGWWNESATGVNYPYGYDPTVAVTILDEAGFQDYDDNGIRNYPLDWPTKPGEDLDPIIFYARKDSAPRFAAAKLLRDAMLSIDIPVDFRPQTFAGVYDPVFKSRDYHIYTGAWGVGRFPTYLYFLYHSNFWFPVGPNYVAPPGMYPELDVLLEGIYFAASFDEAIANCKKALGIFVENVITIPLWNFKYYYAYRKGLQGIVSMDAYGIDNSYTFLNAYKVGESPIRMGLIHPPIRLNPLYTSDYYGWQVLDRIYTGLLSNAPYDVARDQPWVAQDWDVSTWIDPDAGEEKTKLIFWFRKDSYFSDGVQFTAEDYAFSMWYIYAFPDAWNWDAAMDIHHIELKDFNDDGWKEAEVYMDKLSFWTLYAPTYPLLPKHRWLRAPLTTTDTPITESHTVTTPDKVPLSGKPVWIESVHSPTLGRDLVRFTEWNWVKGKLEILADLGTVNIEVIYWAAGDARGYTPSDLPWKEILIGNGIYKLIDLQPGVGGWAVFERNSYSTIDVPLGEVDFYWHWQDTTKPRGGNYRIDHNDLELVHAAYGSTGDGIPDPTWFPGADLFPLSGLIDDFDLAVVYCALSPSTENHDVAVTNVTPLKTAVSQGKRLPINVTVVNQGCYKETFNVGVRANLVSVATKSITLASGESATITLIWDTTRFAGNYTISAYAGPITPLDAECDLSDNILIDDTVKVELTRPILQRTWPEHYKYSVSTDEDGYNTLFARVRNKHAPKEVKVVYITFDKRTGLRIGPILEATTTLAFGETRNLQVNFHPSDFGWLPETKVKYEVVVELYYLDEFASKWIWAQRSNFVFTVMP